MKCELFNPTFQAVPLQQLNRKIVTRICNVSEMCPTNPVLLVTRMLQHGLPVLSSAAQVADENTAVGQRTRLAGDEGKKAMPAEPKLRTSGMRIFTAIKLKRKAKHET
ncbi:hypothetical protein PR048_006681 [Dryococelus australis]|uniref:Uncharacterized protein n=1 Tax=Dryococelus australis TaxID=614101 RepID=A0ABQ9IBN5_9NEOP|nr:hypothetical protein PR048_006681 [Dryococelus australis]